MSRKTLAILVVLFLIISIGGCMEDGVEVVSIKDDEHENDFDARYPGISQIILAENGELATTFILEDEVKTQVEEGELLYYEIAFDFRSDETEELFLRLTINESGKNWVFIEKNGSEIIKKLKNDEFPGNFDIKKSSIYMNVKKEKINLDLNKNLSWKSKAFYKSQGKEEVNDFVPENGWVNVR